jgi:hypothetical protein
MLVFQATQQLQVRQSTLPSLCSKYISVYLFSYEILFHFYLLLGSILRSNGLAVFSTLFNLERISKPII